MMFTFARSSQQNRPYSTNFHRFPDLPAEIRLQIWKESLPRRIVPVDTRRVCPGHSDWLRPPSISRVCREARSVVFQHGDLRWAECITGPGKYWQKKWVDPTTDILYIDTIEKLFNDIPEDVQASHILTITPKPEVVIITRNYLTFHKLDVTVRLLESLGNPFLYIADNHIMHITKQEALDSRLFGSEAEETTVLVDLEDKDRLEEFVPLCSHTDINLSNVENQIQYLEDPSQPKYLSLKHKIHRDFAQVWLRLPQHGIPQREDIRDDPSFEGLYDISGSLNHDHPTIMKALDSMPNYRAMFTFQWCQNPQHLLILEHLSDRGKFYEVCQDLWRKQIHSPETLKEYLLSNSLL